MKKLEDMVQKARSEASGKEMRKGGKTKDCYAMGGVGKQRKGEMSKSGAPMAPKLPKKK